MSHLNLHKTFCIPHGGGGPGVGPVGVREHLAPYLPAHPMHPEPEKRTGIGPISAAPYGSAGILPISWAYVRMMGAEGLTEATAVPCSRRTTSPSGCSEHFPVLYRGHNDRVAHECILDLRGLTKASGVSVDDVAKRLIDYGFHAPTMSFPVAGTLMVEPTESEDLGELDRFCDAMIAIREEIDEVEAGEWTPGELPLRGAPHTAASVITGEWDRAYSARSAVVPGRVRPGQVLAAGRPDRPGVRRPQPGLLLPAARGLRRVTRRTDATARRSSTATRPTGGCPSLVAGRARDGAESGWSGIAGRRDDRPTRSTGSARSPRP